MTRTFLLLAAICPALILHSYAPDRLTAALTIGCWAGLCAIACILWVECDRAPGKVIAIDSKRRPVDRAQGQQLMLGQQRTLAVAEVAMQGFPSAEDQRLALALVPTQQDCEAAILALYGQFKVQRADVPTIEALSTVASPRADFAAILMRRATVTIREER